MLAYKTHIRKKIEQKRFNANWAASLACNNAIAACSLVCSNTSLARYKASLACRNGSLACINTS